MKGIFTFILVLTTLLSHTVYGGLLPTKSGVLKGDSGKNKGIDVGAKTISRLLSLPTDNQKDISLTAIIDVKINHHFPFEIKANKTIVTLEIVTASAWNTAEEPTNDILTYKRDVTIEYDPSKPEFTDKISLEYSGVQYISVKVIAARPANNPNLTLFTLPSNIEILANLYVDRITYFNPKPKGSVPNIKSKNEIDLDEDNIFDELEVVWNVVTGAEAYELEWTFVNNYGEGSTTKSNVDFDFVHNSTRITQSGTKYRIPLIYDKGFIIYRVRAIGRNFNKINKLLYSNWSILDNVTTTQSLNSLEFYEVKTAFEKGKNWQYSATFAEEAKKKEVISFFDGSLRNRQMVTKINSDNNVIVGETIYDHQGRAAIQVLPAPVFPPPSSVNTKKLSSSLKYYANNVLDNFGGEFNRVDFDNLSGGASVCELLSPPLSQNTGAGLYYSPNNKSINSKSKNGFIQSMVPDAKGFPYSQTVYTQDNTGRIKIQGGVGEQFGVNDNSTKYFYGHPSQIELDRLFGSEVGYASHYQKNLVVDPNGQVSISYLDQEGRVIATGLAGKKPTNLEAIPSFSSAARKLKDDLIKSGNRLSSDGKSLQVNEKYLVSSAGQVNFDYLLETTPFNDDCLKDFVCFQCVYDFKFQVTDDCGNVMYSKSGMNSTFTIDSNGKKIFSLLCRPEAPFNPMIDVVDFKKVGSYQITKTLTINEDARKFYLEQYLLKNLNFCYKTFEDFKEEYTKKTSTEDCGSLQNCDACAAKALELYKKREIDEEHYNEMVRICRMPCKEASYCDVLKSQLLGDMRPGGQYAQFKDDAGDINPTIFPLSIFNKNNMLPATLRGEEAEAWRNPIYKNSGSENDGELHYYDDNGNVALIQLDNVTIEGNGSNAEYLTSEPAVIPNTRIIKLQDSYYVEPQNLLEISDFVRNFKTSWTNSLYYYHPEYAYHESCLNLQSKNPIKKISSEQFDSKLTDIKTAADAKALGYYAKNSDYSNPGGSVYDPFYDISIMGDLLKSRLINYKTIEGKTLSLKQYAALIARCGGGVGINPSTLSDNDPCLAYGAPTPDDPSMYIQDLEWSTYSRLYYSLKQEVFLEVTHRSTIANNGNQYSGYNGCIGNEDFDPLHYDFLSVEDGIDGSSYNEKTQPCSIFTKDLYKDKVCRYSTPKPMTDEEIFTEAKKSSYLSFAETGMCPMTGATLGFLSDLIRRKSLDKDVLSLKSSGAYSTLHQIENNNDPKIPIPNGQWKVSKSTPTQIVGDIVVNGDTKWNITLNNNTAYTWSKIEYFVAMRSTGKSNGSNTFEANALVTEPTKGEKLNILITGSTTIPIDGCSFEDICELNETGLELKKLIKDLTPLNVLLSATPYDLKGNNADKPNLIPNRIAQLVKINTNPGPSLFWQYDATNEQIKIFENNTKYLRNRVSATSFPTNLTYVKEVGFDKNETFYVVFTDLTTTQRVDFAQWELVEGKTVKKIDIGNCGLPEPVSCQGIEFDNLNYLLENYNAVFATGNYIGTDKFSSFIDKNLLIQYGPKPKSEIVIDQTATLPTLTIELYNILNVGAHQIPTRSSCTETIVSKTAGVDLSTIKFLVADSVDKRKSVIGDGGNVSFEGKVTLQNGSVVEVTFSGCIPIDKCPEPCFDVEETGCLFEVSENDLKAFRTIYYDEFKINQSNAITYKNDYFKQISDFNSSAFAIQNNYKITLTEDEFWFYYMIRGELIPSEYLRIMKDIEISGFTFFPTITNEFCNEFLGFNFEDFCFLPFRKYTNEISRIAKNIELNSSKLYNKKLPYIFDYGQFISNGFCSNCETGYTKYVDGILNGSINSRILMSLDIIEDQYKKCSEPCEEYCSVVFDSERMGYVRNSYTNPNQLATRFKCSTEINNLANKLIEYNNSPYSNAKSHILPTPGGKFLADEIGFAFFDDCECLYNYTDYLNDYCLLPSNSNEPLPNLFRNYNDCKSESILFKKQYYDYLDAFSEFNNFLEVNDLFFLSQNIFFFNYSEFVDLKLYTCVDDYNSYLRKIISGDYALMETNSNLEYVLDLNTFCKTKCKPNDSYYYTITSSELGNSKGIVNPSSETRLLCTGNNNKSVENFKHLLQRFNASTFAQSKSLKLESPTQLEIETFIYGSEDCSCYDNYVNYLQDYIDGNTSTLPVKSIKDFTNCDNLLMTTPQDAECFNKYIEYKKRLNLAYGKNRFTDYTFYDYSSFISSGLCNQQCFDAYCVALGGIIDGSYQFPNGTTFFADLNSFCKKYNMNDFTRDYYGERNKTSVIFNKYRINFDNPNETGTSAKLKGLCNPPIPPDTLKVVVVDDPCQEYLTHIVEVNAHNAFRNLTADLVAKFNKNYTEHCLKTPKESLIRSAEDAEHHYTLYYYDQAGNLVRTVPPEGVAILPISAHNDKLELDIERDRASGTSTVKTNHFMASTYAYNSLNQLIGQRIPDHETMDRFTINVPSILDQLKITSIQMISKTNGYLTAYRDAPEVPLATRGYLFKTIDGGLKWEHVEGVVGANIKKAKMIDANIGFAVGENGAVLYTQDGATWDLINTMSLGIQARFIDVHATYDALTRFPTARAITDDGRVLTIVGGINGSFNLNFGATQLNLPNSTVTKLLDVDFVDNRYLYLVEYKDNATSVVENVFASEQLTLIGFPLQLSPETVTSSGLVLVQPYDATNAKGFLNNKTLDLVTPLTGSAFKQRLNNSTNLTGIVKPTFVSQNRAVAMLKRSDNFGFDLVQTHDGGVNWVKLNQQILDFQFIGLSGDNIELLVNNYSFIGNSYSTVSSTNTVNSVRLVNEEIPSNLFVLRENGTRTLYGVNDFNVVVSATLNSTDAVENIKFNPLTNLNLLDEVSVKTIKAGHGLNGSRTIFVHLSDNTIKVVHRNNTTSAYQLFQINPAQKFVGVEVVKESNGNYYGVAFNGATKFLHTLRPNFTNTAFNSTQIGLINAIPNLPGIGMNSSMTMTSSNRVILSGTNGELLCTEPLGNALSIEFLTLPWSNRSNISSTGLTALASALSGTTNAIAVGNKGAVYIRTSGGNLNNGTWKYVQSLSNNDLTVVAAKGATAFIGGLGGYLSRYDIATNSNVIQNFFSSISRSEFNFKSIAINPKAGSEKVAAIADNDVNSYYFINDNFSSGFTVKEFVGQVLNTVEFQSGYDDRVSVFGLNSRLYWFTGLQSNMYNKNIFPPRLNDVQVSGKDYNFASIVGDFGFMRTTNDLNGNLVIGIPNIPALGTIWKVEVPLRLNVGNLTHTWVTPINANRYVALAGGANYLASANGLGQQKESVGTIGLTASVTEFKFKNNTITSGYFSTERAIYPISINAATGGITIGTSIYNGNALSSVNALHVFDNDGILAVGTNNLIVYRPNKTGATFSAVSTGTVGSFNDVEFFNGIGYLVGNNRVLLRSDAISTTSDGFINGISWKAVGTVDPYATGLNQAHITAVGYKGSNTVVYGGNYTTAYTNPKDNQTTFLRRAIDEIGLFSSRFYYDKLGRLVVSQNSRQYAMNPQRFSYTLYDGLGRVYEAGEKADGDATIAFKDIFNKQMVIDDILLDKWVNASGTLTRFEVTRSFYDEPNKEIMKGLPTDVDFKPEVSKQRKRISHVTYEEKFDGIVGTYDHATHYDYDIHGNVKTLLQDNKKMGSITELANQRVKRFDYSYDLISGNVHRVSFQTGKEDQWHHAYTYDADNRIIEAYTTTHTPLFKTYSMTQVGVNNEPSKVRYWEKDANYFYYDHGPLARVELGQEQIQGVDYTYTLQGWMKGVNSESLNKLNDPGFDGVVGANANDNDNTNANDNDNDMFAIDAFGFGLHYYKGDYTPINSSRSGFQATQNETSNLSKNSADLYNGNIGRMVTTLTNPITRDVLPLGNAYRYDQLNRLVKAESFTNLDIATNVWGDNGKGIYQNNFVYDGNGNIMKQTRSDEKGELFDDLSYVYQQSGTRKINNRLYHVNDVVVADKQKDDVDNQGSVYQINVNSNYLYDQEGRLIKDIAEGINKITWRVDGKVKTVERSTNDANVPEKSMVAFEYDAMGHRIAKHVYNNTTKALKSSTYYVLDAQGNTMSVYKRDINTSNQTTTFNQTERYIYGSSRLGVNNEVVRLFQPSVTPSDFVRTIGRKNYELSNHLGNVLTVVSDKPVPHLNGVKVDYWMADIKQATDYSPFGAQLYGRNLSPSGSTGDYRFGFNGMEEDDELKGDGNSYDFGARMYDARLGRWLSVDGLVGSFPSLSSYSFYRNNPLIYMDHNGESGIITITAAQNGNPGIVKVSMNVTIYGGAASPKLAAELQSSIKAKLSEHLKTVSVNGEPYNIEWDINFNYSEYDAAHADARGAFSTSVGNEDYSKNYVRVEFSNENQKSDKTLGDRAGSVNHMGDRAGGNNGFWVGSALTDKTSPLHELLHGLGLIHDDQIKTGTSPSAITPTGEPSSNFPNISPSNIIVTTDGSEIKPSSRVPMLGEFITVLEKAGYVINSTRTGIVNVTFNGGKNQVNVGVLTNNIYNNQGKVNNVFNPQDKKPEDAQE